MVISVFRLETGAPFTGLQGPHESRQPGVSLPSTTPFEQPRQGRPGPLCLCSKPPKQKKTSRKGEAASYDHIQAVSEVTVLSQQVTEGFTPQTFWQVLLFPSARSLNVKADATQVWRRGTNPPGWSFVTVHMNNLIQLAALTATQVDSVPDESPFTCLLRCMLRAHAPGPAATLKHCSHWPQGTGPHILSVLPAEDTRSPSPPGCMMHKSSPLPLNPLLLSSRWPPHL